MKKALTTALLILMVLPGLVIAQDEESSKKFKPTVVISSNKVALANVGRWVELNNKYWAPHFDKLVDDGKLISWGVITHAWGDEWSVVVHYVAKDFATFQKAWGEGLKAFSENTPEELNDEMINMILEHKDSIYTGQHYYDGHSGAKE
jgi:hypothetical protein